MGRVLIPVLCILFIGYGFQAYLGHTAGAANELTHKMVPAVSADEVLKLIAQGKKVVFVDARENGEWDEEHIPGAINVSLRDIASLDAKTLGDPDLVIAYCLKDFRGFEVAKALQNANIKSASILSEFGINGWKGKGLPTVVKGKQSEMQAAMALQARANATLHSGIKE